MGSIEKAEKLMEKLEEQNLLSPFEEIEEEDEDGEVYRIDLNANKVVKVESETLLAREVPGEDATSKKIMGGPQEVSGNIVSSSKISWGAKDIVIKDKQEFTIQDALEERNHQSKWMQTGVMFHEKMRNSAKKHIRGEIETSTEFIREAIDNEWIPEYIRVQLREIEDDLWDMMRKMRGHHIGKDKPGHPDVEKLIERHMEEQVSKLVEGLK